MNDDELIDDLLEALTKRVGTSQLLVRLIRQGGDQHWYRRGDDIDPPLLLITGPEVHAAYKAITEAGPS